MARVSTHAGDQTQVSVLFNEPKLLKFTLTFLYNEDTNSGFSALQRAEIAEMVAAITPSAT